MRSVSRGLLLCPIVAVACGKVQGSGPDAGPVLIDATVPATITLHNAIGNGQTANAAVAAVQDGDGPWQVITGTGGTYTFPVASGRYGLAVVCDRTAPTVGIPFNEVFVRYYATGDGSELSVFSDCLAKAPTTVAISGTTLGTQTGDTISIASNASATQGPPGNWSTQAVAGPGILLGRRLTNNRPIGLLFDQVTYAAGATFTLDFSKQIFPTEVGMTPDPSDSNPFISTTYIDPTGSSFIIDQPANPVTTYRVPPPDKIGNGISVLSESNITNNTASRSVEIAFKTPTARTITEPQTFAPASPPTLATSTPYPTYAVTLPRTDHPLAYDVSYSGTMPGTQNGLTSWVMTYSAGWLTASGKAGADLASALPDLSMLAGWKPSYALPATKVNWSVTAHTGPAHRLAGIVVQGAPAIQDGDVVTTSQSSGTLP